MAETLGRMAAHLALLELLQEAYAYEEIPCHLLDRKIVDGREEFDSTLQRALFR